MSLRLPIYEDYRPTAAEVEVALTVDRDMFEPRGKGRNCNRCDLNQPGLRTPALSAMGSPGGLLVVGEWPTKEDDMLGQPMTGSPGAFMRKVIKEHWTGPVAYDLMLRCWPRSSKDVKPKHVTACRGFLTKTIEEVAPTRIIALGAASQALFGRTVSPMMQRGAYSWLQGGAKPIPCFFVLHPTMAMRNRFVRQWFEHDMKHALTTPDPPPGPWEAEATIIGNANLALLAERVLMKQRWVAFDVETAGTMWNEDFRIISVALCGADEDDAWVWSAEALEDDARRAVLIRLLMSKRLPKVGQNVKYDQLAFRARYGVKVTPIIIDTRLQRKLLAPEADGGLGKMAELVGMGGHKEEAQGHMKEIVARVKRAFNAKNTDKKPDQREQKIAALALPAHLEAAFRLGDDPERHMFDLLPPETLHRYNARDAVVTKKLAVMHEEQIAQEPALKRMWDVQVRPAAVALERIEGWGVATSRDAINAFDRYLEQREIGCKKVLDQYGSDIDWGSTPQVSDLLFNKLGLHRGLKEIRVTGGGKPSTDAESLNILAKASGHPLPAALIDYRFVTKLRGTYAQGMFPHVRSDGRIHPNIKLDGARSGRTSCTDPNLQNIPRAQTPEGKMARDCFVATKGFVLLEADYSQLELRVAAMLSGDKVMLEIFNSGVDYHLKTAQLISQIAWGIPPEKVTDTERSLAKNVNFGVLYGKTAHTFSKEWGISKTKAQTIVDAIMGNFKDLQRWCSARETEAAKTGYVWTWWKGEKARRRPLWQIADQDDAKASVAKNGAKNTPIQGTASDFCIASLVQAVQWIESDGIEDMVKLILAVHDSLMFEVRADMLDETAATVNDIMLSHDSNGVPLIADFKYGDAWGSMHDAHVVGGKLVHSDGCKMCKKK